MTSAKIEPKPRFTVEVLRTQPLAFRETEDIAAHVQQALNSEAHQDHGLEGIVGLTNGCTLVVWRTA